MLNELADASQADVLEQQRSAGVENARGARRAQSIVIGIAGGSGSGKSWLARFLQRELGGDAAVISQDWYYRNQTGLEPGREAELNFDHPDAFDWACLIGHLDALRHGDSIETPRYDYRTHARLPGECLQPAPLILIEGILVLHDPAVRQQLAHSVFVDTPADLRLIRRIRRDAADRALPMEETLRLYETFVRPMHEQYVQPSVRWADCVWNTRQQPRYPEELAASARNML